MVSFYYYDPGLCSYPPKKCPPPPGDKMRHRLVSHKDASLQSAGHSYSTCSIEYSYTQPTAIRDYYKIFLLPKDNFRMEQTPKGYSIVQFAGCF